MQSRNYFFKPGLEDYGHQMYDLIKKLFPFCRSITGNGVRETLQEIQKVVDLDIKEVKSKEKVFDWQVPDEWNIRDAWVKNANGKKVIDFNKLNLHVLNYSIPVDKKLSLSELKKHLFTFPEYPDWVPYRTSYHNRQWGFCMAHNEMLSLKEGEYHVYIDSTLEPGSLTYGEFLLPGRIDDEVLFSCHICHPSLCNDNLSGIVVATHLAKKLQSIQLNNSYRFLFIPGTIGSITWLSKNKTSVARIKNGLVLTLLGDESSFHYKRSRSGNTSIDRIMIYLLNQLGKPHSIRDFSPWGYDERQFCSPGFNLPVGRISRKPHGEFPEYHTSADNLDFVKPDFLAESLVLLLNAVYVIENNKKYLNMNPFGEPQLGKRGLYKSIGGQSTQKDFQLALLWILNLSDGKHTLLDIAECSGLPFDILVRASSELKETGLLSVVKN